MRCFLWLYLTLLATTTFAQLYPKALVLSDLDFVYRSLPSAAYDLYAYSSEEVFSKQYLAIRESLTKDSFDFREATNAFQQLVSSAHIGHAEIDFPAPAYRRYAMAGGTVFPLELAFERGKVYIRRNFSTQTDIPLGAELLQIDGKDIGYYLACIYPQISAERRYLKHAKMEFYSFPRLYWQVFGQRDEFAILVRTEQGTKEWALSAVDLIDGYELKRTDIVAGQQNLQFHHDGRVAFLQPGQFAGDEEPFRQFIDSAFLRIREAGSDQLILDLRNHGGGHDAFSDYLIAYFADRPFQWQSEFHLRTSRLLQEQTRQQEDSSDSYSQAILTHSPGEAYPWRFEPQSPRPEAERFKGTVYVLVNRQTYSMAAVTAGLLQDYGFAKVVGEETGDFPSLQAAQFSYPLPETGIVLKIPKGRIVRVSGHSLGEGVQPDVYIGDHLLDEEDEILEGLLDLLKRL
ncbi:MAG: S41 family peptidase [Bacteroidota bacterium]